jgi:hypothetical protein
MNVISSVALDLHENEKILLMTVMYFPLWKKYIPLLYDFFLLWHVNQLEFIFLSHKRLHKQSKNSFWDHLNLHACIKTKTYKKSAYLNNKNHSSKEVEQILAHPHIRMFCSNSNRKYTTQQLLEWYLIRFNKFVIQNFNGNLMKLST